MGGQQQQQGAMMPGRVPVQQKEKQMIWSGELEWQKKVKDGANEQKLSHSVSCTVSSTMVSFETFTQCMVKYETFTKCVMYIIFYYGKLRNFYTVCHVQYLLLW